MISVVERARLIGLLKQLQPVFTGGPVNFVQLFGHVFVKKGYTLTR